ncbi:MAG: DUF5916 domain-containing protein [Thalassotalea sp.]|nr:DUF5916 domain-containing protein [Thalassotalea sp.]MDG2393036.1 DUF5916 domain-containing protein [Thalassotalea sp.]
MILLRKGAKYISALILFANLPFQTVAQQQTLTIPHIKSDIVFDGELNEPVWQQAKRIDLNIVNYPYDNTPSPVKTEAYIFEDGVNVYFAFKAHDPNPEKIQGFLRDHDEAFADDIVGVKLDTFNDHRLAYKFFVNPYGVQNDGIVNEMTGDDNILWDAIWTSYGKVTDDGYQVEFAIPYRELNFEEGSDIKTWGIELIRVYPRDNILRISHIALDRDNSCWSCQMVPVQGFEQAKLGKNLLVTPSVVASRNEDRDVYNDQNWQTEDNIDLGLNVRWGITPDIMLNATINPDFSTVESDSGQLQVNKKYALFYDEKRPFFLDNSEYFSSQFNLVYTRNIADPDFGTKLTGRLDNSSFGFFMTKDNATNIILPGNTYSLPETIDEESYSGALRYRYDVNQDLSFGFISTLRESDSYHNFVTGVDGKYKLNVSNSITAQALTSETQYPIELYDYWCANDDCYLPSLIGKYDDEFSDQAYKLGFEHNSEFWLVDVNYEDIGKDFRADLGYMPKVDIKKFTTDIVNTLYGENTWWTEIKLGANYQITHNQNDQLISKRSAASFTIQGPMQSLFDVIISQEDSVGLRFNTNDNAIDNNTTMFEQNQLQLYLGFQPRANLYLETFTLLGEAIDYDNNRLGDIIELSPRVIYNMSEHLELDLGYTYAELEADNDYVYRENITNARLTYMFDVNSYLRLTMVYTQTDFNKDNNPDVFIESEQQDSLASQLIYSYKLNPQTVFFLGYSDSSIENQKLKSLKQEQRTAFLKLSYAWM